MTLYLTCPNNSNLLALISAVMIMESESGFQKIFLYGHFYMICKLSNEDTIYLNYSYINKLYLNFSFISFIWIPQQDLEKNWLHNTDKEKFFTLRCGQVYLVGQRLPSWQRWRHIDVNIELYYGKNSQISSFTRSSYPFYMMTSFLHLEVTRTIF